MSTTSVANAHPMVGRTILKATAGVVLFAGLCGGVYQGAQAITAHAQQPSTNVSYATTDRIARTIHGANHAAATQGAFLPTANITTGNVVSVVKVAN